MNRLSSLATARRFVFSMMAFAVVALLASPAAAQSEVQGWHTRLDVAQRVARETGKPIFLVFRCVR